MPQTNRLQSQSGKSSQNAATRRKITPELVRLVTDRVYSLLREALLIEQERAHTRSVLRNGGFRR